MDQCGKAVIIHLGMLLGLQTIIPMAKKPKRAGKKKPPTTTTTKEE